MNASILHNFFAFDFDWIWCVLDFISMLHHLQMILHIPQLFPHNNYEILMDVPASKRQMNRKLMKLIFRRSDEIKTQNPKKHAKMIAKMNGVVFWMSLAFAVHPFVFAWQYIYFSGAIFCFGFFCCRLYPISAHIVLILKWQGIVQWNGKTHHYNDHATNNNSNNKKLSNEKQ